ncbi:PREDICTED: nuclear receptor-interacting protein 3 [Nanorana parkeri]|uniref:nuclear receptor-interacting protein 3 n=1 Tax=Nanorana parkeri TaxID=125878 RepID=UPI0008545576|nr:PREDICTED: nuclear receptor-interacting protein 3 [Nanorana parkeri]
MFYSGIMTEGSGGRKDADLREAASLRQQRKMKQSVQFIHKDSADLLPLDGLKKLGTSKDTQPHNILQRRLLESNLTKLRNNRTTWTPKTDHSSQSNKQSHGKVATPRRSEEDDALYVWGQCSGKEMKVKIDTSCQHSVISSACLDRLGLKEHFRFHNNEEDSITLPYNVNALGQIDRMPVTLGGVAVECSAVVIDDNERIVSLGLQALRHLKCVINLEKSQLEVGRSDKEVIPFIASRSTAKEEHWYLKEPADTLQRNSRQKQLCSVVRSGEEVTAMQQRRIIACGRMSSSTCCSSRYRNAHTCEDLSVTGTPHNPKNYKCQPGFLPLDELRVL